MIGKSCVGSMRSLTVKRRSQRGLLLVGNRLKRARVQLAVRERHCNWEPWGALNVQQAPVMADWRYRVSVVSGVARGQAAGPSTSRRWTVGAIPRSGAAAFWIWSHRTRVELHAPRAYPGGSLVDECGEVHLDGDVCGSCWPLFDKSGPSRALPRRH